MTNHLLAHDHSDLDAALAAAVAALAAGDVDLSYQTVDIFFARLAMHIRAENVHLFPTLVEASNEADPGSEAPQPDVVHDTTARLRHDHDFFMSELAAALKELRDFQRDGVGHADEVLADVSRRLTGVSERLETHNALEESEVYHWAGALLNDSEQKALGEAIQRELENLPARLRKRES